MSRHRKRSRQESIPENSNGFNLNNLDLSGIASMINNIDMNELSAMINNVVKSEGSSEKEENNRELQDYGRPVRETNSGDATSRKREILRALRVLINADKSELLQIVVQLYASGRNRK